MGWGAAALLLAACPKEGEAPSAGEGTALELDKKDGGALIVPADAADPGDAAGDGETVVVLEPAPGQGPIDPLSPQMLEAAARAAEAAEASETQAAEAGAPRVDPIEHAGPIDPNEGRAVGRIAQLKPERVSPFTILPALSHDGRHVAVSRYEQFEDQAFVEIQRVRDGRTVRRFELGWDGKGARRINRALKRGAFRTMPAAASEPRSPAQDDWQQRSTTWEMDELELRYDPQSGGLAFYEDYRLIGQTLIGARAGNFRGVPGTEDAEPRLVPDVLSVFASEDGQVIAVELGLCNCSCDVDPFWRVFRRDELPMPE